MIRYDKQHEIKEELASKQDRVLRKDIKESLEEISSKLTVELIGIFPIKLNV